MLITFLMNDGFIIELDNHILVFDYYKGNLPKFNPNKAMYVFVSHSHRDHYNPAIYQIEHPSIQYILSSDVKNKGIIMEPHQTKQIDDLQVSTLLSTDLGVAFIVEVEGKTIFHAGDLNWWHWIGEPKEDNEYQERVFKQEIDLIKDISFDLMMLPLDPRLETTAWWGMHYILQHVQTKYVLPMHCLMKLSKMNQYLKEEPLNQYDNILEIHKKESVFTIDE